MWVVLIIEDTKDLPDFSTLADSNAQISQHPRGTTIKLWMNTVDANKKVSIARAINFHKNYEKVLTFVLEMGET